MATPEEGLQRVKDLEGFENLTPSERDDLYRRDPERHKQLMQEMRRRNERRAGIR